MKTPRGLVGLKNNWRSNRGFRNVLRESVALSGCGREYPIKPISLCDLCFSPLEAIYDYKSLAEAVSRETLSSGPVSMWRYRDLLPVDGEVVDIGAGFTPLVKADHLGRQLGLEQLHIKNDCLNPTFSFKDRVVSVAITKAREFRFDTVACAS